VGNYAACCNAAPDIECPIATACLNTSLLVGPASEQIFTWYVQWTTLLVFGLTRTLSQQWHWVPDCMRNGHRIRRYWQCDRYCLLAKLERRRLECYQKRRWVMPFGLTHSHIIANPIILIYSAYGHDYLLFSGNHPYPFNDDYSNYLFTSID